MDKNYYIEEIAVGGVSGSFSYSITLPSGLSFNNAFYANVYPKGTVINFNGNSIIDNMSISYSDIQIEEIPED